MFIPFVVLHPLSFCDKIPEKSLPEGNNLEQQIIDVLNQFVAVKNEYNQQGVVSKQLKRLLRGSASFI